MTERTPASALDTHDAVDGDHGRIEIGSVPGKQSLAVKRKSAGWNDTFLLKVVTRVA